MKQMTYPKSPHCHLQTIGHNRDLSHFFNLDIFHCQEQTIMFLRRRDLCTDFQGKLQLNDAF